MNIHDKEIIFEPIHRVLKGVKRNWLESIKRFFSNKIHIENIPNFNDLSSKVRICQSNTQIFGAFYGSNHWVIRIEEPIHSLTVGSVQKCIDWLIAEEKIKDVDYIHGEKAIRDLGSKPGNAGIYLAAIEKDALFNSVIKDGVLPRKTFSMGEAHQKRFYLECRKIKQ